MYYFRALCFAEVGVWVLWEVAMRDGFEAARLDTGVLLIVRGRVGAVAVFHAWKYIYRVCATVFLVLGAMRWRRVVKFQANRKSF